MGHRGTRPVGRRKGVDLDRDVITLRRGDEKIARITRLVDRVPVDRGPGDHEPAARAAAKEDEPVRTERLFQGKPESDWKRLFAAETEPVSKLEAASALLALSGELPTQTRLERILDVGEEIVRASFDKSRGFPGKFRNSFAPGSFDRRRSSRS